jgi:hypothetical protein
MLLLLGATASHWLLFCATEINIVLNSGQQDDSPPLLAALCSAPTLLLLYRLKQSKFFKHKIHAQSTQEHARLCNVPHFPGFSNLNFALLKILRSLCELQMLIRWTTSTQCSQPQQILGQALGKSVESMSNL